MAKPQRTTAPAFQFYPKDFLSSSRVQRMTLTEVGVYIVLLSHCWLSGGIPTEPAEIAKLVKMPAPRFKRLWAGALSECFIKRGSALINSRLESERQKQIAYREKQKENGKKGGRRLTQAFPTASPTPSPRVMETADRDPVLQDQKEERLDLAFIAFREAYPRERRKGGHLMEVAFLDAVHAAGGAARLMAALRNHIASEQWSNPRLIPGMDTWLTEERWRQELPAAGAVTSSGNNPKTAGNVGAFQRFIERGKTA